jgi:hypothetical protein
MHVLRPKPMKTILPRFVSAACILMAASAFADTKLVTDGAPLRYLVPSNGDLGGTWRGAGFNDSSWQTGVNGIGYEVNPGSYSANVIADSQAEFSTLGRHGANGWVNGYYNLTGDSDATYQVTDFQPFPRSDGPHAADNFWNGGAWDWFNGNPPWDEIGAAAVHPNGINYSEEHWVIRRWHSTVAGPITLRFQARKTNPGGTGVTGKAFKNGVELLTQTIAGADQTGFDAYINTTATIGDVFDFALTPVGVGGDPTDGADGSITIATILSGTVTPPPPPPQPNVVADSQSDWSTSGAQGANNWHYGFYSQTVDTDGVYNPNTEFNTTDPMWTFAGGAWQLGRTNLTTGVPEPGANPPWDTIGTTSWHPNGNNNLPEGIHWVIRRWVSEVSGDLYARVRFSKTGTGGNGTTVKVLHNGAVRFSGVLNQTATLEAIVSLPGVLMGDKIEFALTSQGIDGGFGDGSDTSNFTGTIFTGAPPQTPVANSLRDWADNTQGANGWSYGYYNETADTDGAYTPSTDFNSVDPNWTWRGATWQLGVDGNAGANPPWTAVGQTFWHPNGNNQPQGAQWAIRRWVSGVDGDFHVNIRFGKQNVGGGNGTTLRVFHNGIQIFSQTVAFNNANGINTNIALPGVFLGDAIDFALDPLGTDGTKADASDGSYLVASILPGPPPQPPRGFLPGVANCIDTDIESAMRGVNPSVFIRIPFNVSDPAAVESLRLKMKYNDGFAAYINGTEIVKRNAPTGIAGITVADSIADWSTDPNVTVNGWSYGYYNHSLDTDGLYGGGSDFTPFPHDGGGHSATDMWNPRTGGYDWFNGDPPWTEMYREATHPNHPNTGVVDPNIPGTHLHWTIRRWSATVDANLLKARIRFSKLNIDCGDGVRLSVFHNSRQVYSETITGNDGVGRDDTIELADVFLGDNIDVLLGPGDATDYCDGTAFSVVFFEGEPSIPWNGAATASRTPSQTISPEAFDISNFISELRPGLNVLAIQGFNAGISDNEFVIKPELLATRVPIAVDDNVRALIDTPTTYPASALLGNDSDPDGDLLMLVGVTPTYTTSAGGAVRLFGDTVRYTPPAGFSGADTFIYTMTDVSGVPKRATVAVRVAPPNRCPTASDSSIPVDQGGAASFQLQASDPDGDPLQYTVTLAPSKGTVVIDTQTGAATYSPAPGACGSDSFKFKVTDGECESDEAMVSVAINDKTPPQLAPCPAPVTLGPDNPIYYFSPPAAMDGCDGPLQSRCSRHDDKHLDDPYPLGTTKVTCFVRDAADNYAECSFTVTVRDPNRPPVCVAQLAPKECGVTFTSGGQLYTIAVAGDYTCVTLDGAGSSDPDGDTLTINWAIDETNLVAGAVVPACLDVGCHEITMLVSDGRDTCNQFLDICVITPEEAVEQCILLVESTQVERKNKRPLLVSLKAAKAAFTRDGLHVGAQMLRVFQYKCRAQIERNNAAEAALFTDTAENIIKALECVVQTPRRDE